MHALSDQFEVEPRANYSGSYNDIVAYRDMLETGSQFKRQVIASKISGITSKLQEKKVLYNFVLGLSSGSFLGSSVNFAQFLSQEQYYDSFGPNIVDVFTTNSRSIISFNVAQVAPSKPHKGDPDFGIADIHGTASFYLPYSDASHFFSGYGHLADNVWPFAFPFEGKYKALTRILNPSTKLPSKVTVTRGIDGATFTPPIEVDTLGGIAIFISKSSGNVAPVHYIMDVPLAPTNSLSAIVKGGNESSGSNATVKLNQATRASIDTISKTVFSFGDGTTIFLDDGGTGTTGGTRKDLRKKFPEFTDFFDASATNVLGGGGVYLFRPIARGMKYGMINSSPLSTKIVFRLGRFGQFRDMLEQRLFSKLYSTDPVSSRRFVTEGVVTIRFKSGTTVASASNAETATTSSSATFNPKDSGQFNFEYRSGQPFFDDVNLELYRNF